MFNRGRGVPDRGDISDHPTTAGTDPHQIDEPTTADLGDDPGAAPGADSETVPDGHEEAAAAFSDEPSDEPAGPTTSGIAPEAVAAGETTSSVEEMLLRLEGLTTAGEAPSSSGWNRLTDDASSHAELLQGTLDAQKQAQRMLALATKLRGDASAQAEQILHEARAAAARLRQDAARESERAREEIASWAATRRQEIEAAVADLMHAARDDADRIRAEAERTAMESAEETARRYVRQVSAAADRDAESTRAQAREACQQSAIAVNDVQESVQQLAEAVASFLVTSHRQSAQLTSIAETAAAAARTPVEKRPEEPAERGAADPSDPSEQHHDGTDESQGGTTGLPLGSLFRPREWD
jgi:hypothetical protein